ncbi:hypothetical protein GQ53DRAFT_411106 [Thozetella sp. PMI_491]|nr:hypothetical protein GQ53DRAFT_411106 [Thozetella sp. PMI_491]
MASYDPYDPPVRERTTKRSSYYREERDDRDPRHADPRDGYLNVHSSRDLVPRAREDSDLSVEEVRRDFPPPGYSPRDMRRARSAEPGYYEDDYDDRRSTYSRSRHHDRDYDHYDRDSDRRSHRGKAESVYYEEEERKKVRMLSKQEQIVAAITGAALAIGGKELYDRREANQHGTDVHRNIMASAALGAAGALAGYQGTEFYNKRKEKDEKKSTYMLHKGRDGKVSEYYSDEEDAKDKKGHKNFLENALAAAGLGGAVKALTGGGSSKDDKSDTRSRRGSRSRSRSKEKGPANKVQKAAMASLIAGATEAFRVSKEPGGWKGEKAKRILTAAAGAATIDAAQNPDKAGSKLGLAESVIGGLVGNRVINGSKKNIEEDKKTGRSRSRSRARSDGGGGGGGVSGLAALATAGLGAFGAKKIMDNREKSRERSRERSRDRSRRRGGSRDSYDSRDKSPDRNRRSRSRSVVDTARRGLARIGIGNGPDDDDRDHDRRDRRKDHDDYDDSPHASRRHRGRDDYDDDRSHKGGGRDDYDDDRSRGGRDRSRSRARGGGRRDRSASSSDLGDSDEDEKRAKKMRGKQILTTGLAAVATIHAAHNVYQSMEKRNARHKAVKEGRLSPEEAKKLKTKAMLQDAASVGIAALGIKGAISELKEAKELRHEIKEFKEQKVERHNKRLERQQRKLLTNGEDDDDYADEEDYRRRGRAESWSPQRSDRRYYDGPRYADGNPYAPTYKALPPPPLSAAERERDRR